MIQSMYQRRQDGWLSENLKHSNHWRFSFDQATQNFLTDFAKKYHQPDAELFSYDFSEWDLGPAIEVIDQAVEETMLGGGLVILEGLPRRELTEDQIFKLGYWTAYWRYPVPRENLHTVSG